jgi:phenylpropionate dioxygenase-like ring-hydroxylating dioxygenase large terminal subunit
VLTKEENELVSRVGPGTPMGNLMRQYWVPALLSSELPAPDSDPVRVMLLGEKLIAIREPDTALRLFTLEGDAYATRERNGIVWAYMGPRSDPPPLPNLEGNMLEEGTWNVTAIQRECNWLQALEGDIDTSHFSFLHAGSLDKSSQKEGTFSYYMLADRAPRYSVVDTDYGAMYGAYRDTNDGRRYVRLVRPVPHGGQCHQ